MINREELHGDEDGIKVANWPIVAQHLAGRIKNAVGDVELLEVCGGIGATTLELAKEFSQIYSVEIEEKRVQYAKQNLGELAERVDFLVSDIFAPELLARLKNKSIRAVVTDVEWTASGVYGQEWATNIEDTNPSTKKLFTLLTENFTDNIAMRLPKTVDHSQLRALGECEIEEIVKDGKVRFLIAYFGKLKQTAKSQFVVSNDDV